jgi:hypothetical protein
MPKKGQKHSEETKKTMRSLALGKNNPMYGKHHAEESKLKIRLYRIGKHLSEETKRKIGNKSRGRKVSEETREKLRKANLGKKISEEHKKILSKLMTGKKLALGSHHTDEWKKKMSDISKKIGSGKRLIHKKGEDHWNWKGGITLLQEKTRKCFQYRQWRSDIFTRDNFTCQECGFRGKYLAAHHLKPFSVILRENKITTLKEALTCEELWNLNNGITLCRDCHKKTDTYLVKYL